MRDIYKDTADEGTLGRQHYGSWVNIAVGSLRVSGHLKG